METGEKVAMQRIEFADRQANGVVLAVRLRAPYTRHPCPALGQGRVKSAGELFVPIAKLLTAI